MAGNWELMTAIARSTDAGNSGTIDDSAQPIVEVP